MASQPASTPAPHAHGGTVERRHSAGALILAGAVPLLFLHATYQPTVSIGVQGTSVDLTLADLAIAAVAVAALVRGLRTGFAALRTARGVLIAAAAFLAVALVSVGLPRLRGEDYELATHAISAGKLCWYALLAPAVPLLLEQRRDGALLAQAVIVWSAAATSWGALQFLGLVAEFEGRRPGQREPSFVGIHDFAALSGAALLVGVTGLALGSAGLLSRRWTVAALVTGSLGLVLSGAMTGVVGLWLAATVALLIGRSQGQLRGRATVVVAALLILVTAATAVMRADAIERFAEFLGLRDRAPSTDVESYAHRTLLAYIGLRIFLDHPLVGSGFQASSEEWAYGPHLDAARARFPDEPDEAFPSPEHPWGVQNLYVQVLADLGLAGVVALAALAVTGIVAGVRGARASPLATLGLTWLLVAGGVWLGIGLVPGLPLDALTWIALGLVTVRV